MACGRPAAHSVTWHNQVIRTGLPHRRERKREQERPHKRAAEKNARRIDKETAGEDEKAGVPSLDQLREHLTTQQHAYRRRVGRGRDFVH